MLSTKNRARTQDVNFAIVCGKTRHSSFFSLRTAQHSGEPSKAAVVVSKKVAARAVDRNKLKRRVRHIIRAIELPQHTTNILYVKKDARTANTIQLKNDLETLLTT